ncbi:radical SAM protein [Krasilnikovia sp. MM14-A1004]|uniref:radical SAM protein n=1 Tax=Krasilnikovia sp. MM14-A1004 TaxID=3373541 RepID=UPI00399D4105
MNAAIPDQPLEIIWDITYACPLRCVHCYSESGRRPARQLDLPDLLRVADALIAMRPLGISLAGGEPLLVPGLFDVVERFTAAGIKVALFTGGWSVSEELAEQLLRRFFRVSVSVDGATGAAHDRIRGRRGSFDRAMQTLARLDAAAASVPGAVFGIDSVVVRSTVDELDEFCTRIAPRFPALSFLSFGAVVPEGLASRPGFAAHELLTEAQTRLMGSPEQAERLQELAPGTVHVTVTDNLSLQMHPEHIRSGKFFPAMQIEPDGAVRAMPAYEGTVGNILTDPPAELWRRSIDRWHHPYVVETLTPVRTMADWAEATRKIDYRFGSDAVRARLDRRPDFAVP